MKVSSKQGEVLAVVSGIRSFDETGGGCSSEEKGISGRRRLNNFNPTPNDKEKGEQKRSLRTKYMLEMALQNLYREIDGQ